MVIRIGDERREMLDEHLQKLKAQMNSAYVLKDKHNREVLIEALLTCLKHMPHKVGVYSYLLGATAVDNFEFAQEITCKAVELLNQTLIQDGDCFQSKNIMRLLANLVAYSLISVEAFCQFLLTLVEDYLKLGATQADGAQSHSADLILETVLAALPQT